MTQSPPLLFVIDDDPSTRLMAISDLDDKYRVREFASGEDALAAIDEQPNILLLDIEMPGKNGIDVCRELREQGHDELQVLFVSSHDDLETRMAAYNAGGNDYVIKPFSPQELAHKVELAKSSMCTQRALSTNANDAQKIAFTALSSMGEMGAVLAFLRASFSARNPDELASLVFEALEQYNLNGLLSIAWDDATNCYSTTADACSELEKSILQAARNKERIVQSKKSLLVNYPDVVLVVLDLPVEDDDKVGRLRDHLALLVEGASARVESLHNEQLRIRQAEGIVASAGTLSIALEEIAELQRHNRAEAIQESGRLIDELASAFMYLGLTEEQESNLVRLATASNNRISELTDVAELLGNRLRTLQEDLNQLIV